MGVLDPLDQVRDRQADDPDHRADRLAVRLLEEQVDDLAEPPRVDRVALTARAEHVGMLEAGLEHQLDFAPEGVLLQFVLGVPG